MEQAKQKENSKWKYPSSISMASEAQEIPFGYAKYINEESTFTTYNGFRIREFRKQRLPKIRRKFTVHNCFRESKDSMKISSKALTVLIALNEGL